MAFTAFGRQRQSDVENGSYDNAGCSVDDEASSVPGQDGQEERKAERDDEKRDRLPPISRSTDYNVNNRVDPTQAGPSGLRLDARGIGTREKLIPSSSGAVPPRKRQLTPSVLETLEKNAKTEHYKDITKLLIRAKKLGAKNLAKAVSDNLGKYDDLYVHGGPLQEMMQKENTMILHIALLKNRKEISHLLIEQCPEIISEECSSDTFKGLTAFHIAASKGQCEILDLMLKYYKEGEEKLNDLLNARATGTHFTEDNPAGTLPLTAAAWGGHCEMLGMLIEKGADLGGKAHGGNTVLHYIVTRSASHPKSDTPRKLFDVVFKKCTIWWQLYQPTEEEVRPTRPPKTNEEMVKLRVEAFRYLLNIKNDANQTILSLAANLHSNLTKHILNTEHVYKASSGSTYDVTEVTSFPPAHEGKSCRYNSDSVLHILGHRPTKLATGDDDLGDKDLIEEEPIKSLLRMKWRTYRIIYIIWCLVHFLLMLGLSIVSLHLHKPKENKFAFGENATGNATYVTVKESTGQLTGRTEERQFHPWYLVFSLVPLIYLVLEIVDISSTGSNSLKSLETGVTGESKPRSKIYLFYNQWSSIGNGPSRIQLVIFSVSVEIWICLHMIQSDDQDLPLSLAMVLGWIFMVFFTRTCPLICRFSVMMQKMLFHDCIAFLAVYVFFWLAFSTAMHVLLVDGTRSDLQAWNTLYGILNQVTDAGEKETGEDARIPAVGMVLLSMYAVVSVILLLNMLIAMMNTSYEVVKGSKTNIRRYQQLSIMLMLERRLWWWERLCDRSQEGVRIIEQENGAMPKRFFLEVTGSDAGGGENSFVTDPMVSGR